MTKVKMNTDINISPDKLWELIGKFNALPDWHPAVEKSELNEGGTMRRLTLIGGGEIVDKLEISDDNERVYSYSIINSPLPVTNYTASIRVRNGDKGNSSVEWASEFNADGTSEQEAVEIIEGIYQAGFDHLKKMFGG